MNKQRFRIAPLAGIVSTTLGDTFVLTTFASRIDATLTLRALRMAINNRLPGPGIIHHSDQGVQYASDEYVEELKRHGFRISMARKGNPYDNATMESFFKTLKYEEVYLCEYKTSADVMERIPYFIEEVCNLNKTSFGIGISFTK